MIMKRFGGIFPLLTVKAIWGKVDPLMLSYHTSVSKSNFLFAERVPTIKSNSITKSSPCWCLGTVKSLSLELSTGDKWSEPRHECVLSSTKHYYHLNPYFEFDNRIKSCLDNISAQSINNIQPNWNVCLSCDIIQFWAVVWIKFDTLYFACLKY